MDPDAGDITRLLPSWGRGDEAERELFLRLEPHLRELARSALGRMPGLERKVQPDELVNEAYLKLQRYLGARRDVSFENRRFFFAMVMKVMRHVLLDVARRGGQHQPRTTLFLPLSHADVAADRGKAIDAFEFYETLDRLRSKNENQAAAIELHYIAGWTLEQSADLMGLSTATLKRQLVAARQWLEVQLANRT